MEQGIDQLFLDPLRPTNQSLQFDTRPGPSYLEVERIHYAHAGEEGKEVGPMIEMHETMYLMATLFSALSLRIFGEDITAAAREEALKKKESVSEQGTRVGGGGEAEGVEHAREESEV